MWPNFSRLVAVYLYRQEVSIHQISRKLGIGYGTAWNYVQRVKAGRLNSDLGHLSL
jgi:transposase